MYLYLFGRFSNFISNESNGSTLPLDSNLEPPVEMRLDVRYTFYVFTFYASCFTGMPVCQQNEGTNALTSAR